MMRSIVKITATLLFWSISLLLVAQGIAPKATFDNSRIIIGDQVKLRLEVECPSDTKVGFPVLPDSLAPYVEIVERFKIDSASAGANRTKFFQEYTVTSFDSGYHSIKPFVFSVKSNGSIDTLKSNSLLLEVHTLPKLDSLLTALKGPIDIKAPYEAPVTFKEVAPVIFGVLLAAGLIFLILYAMKKRKINQPFFFIPPKPKEPAHLIALRELDKLKEEKIWQQGKTKQYYSELTSILRQYIENRFDIPALEQTTIETISAFKFKRSLLDDKTFDNLMRILTNADLVKFAKYEPLPDENNMALVDSYFFINQTKIVEVVEENKPAEEREGEDVIIKS
jgi:hypothetical protein